MRNTKLTVQIPQDVLDNFRRYAEEKNTTMTSLVEAYLRRIPHQDIPKRLPLSAG